MLNLSQTLLGNIIQIFIVVVISIIILRKVSDFDCKWAYIIAYLIRLILLLISVYGRDILMLPFDGSDTEYFYSAVFLGKEHIEYSVDALVTLTVYLSYILGDSRLLFQYIMLMISMLGLLVTDMSMHKLNIDLKTRYICMFIAAVFPTFAQFNVLYLREAIIMTCTCLSFYSFLCYLMDENKVKRIIYFIASISINLIACAFHPVLFAMIIGYTLAALFYDYQNDCFSISIKSLCILIIFMMGFGLVYIIFPYPFRAIVGLDLETIIWRYMPEVHVQASSSYASYVGRPNTWGEFLLYTPLHTVYAMFSPLPWQWRNVFDVVTFFGNSIFYIIVSLSSLVCFFVRRSWRNFNRWFLLTLLIVSATIGWGVITYGTAVRHRDKFFPLFLIMLSLVITGIKNRRNLQE